MLKGSAQLDHGHLHVRIVRCLQEEVCLASFTLLVFAELHWLSGHLPLEVESGRPRGSLHALHEVFVSNDVSMRQLGSETHDTD